MTTPTISMRCSLGTARFSRDREVALIKDAECHGCGETTTVLHFDHSDEEYGSIRVCHRCVDKLLRGEPPAKARQCSVGWSSPGIPSGYEEDYSEETDR